MGNKGLIFTIVGLIVPAILIIADSSGSNWILGIGNGYIYSMISGGGTNETFFGLTLTEIDLFLDIQNWEGFGPSVSEILGGLSAILFYGKIEGFTLVNSLHGYLMTFGMISAFIGLIFTFFRADIGGILGLLAGILQIIATLLFYTDVDSAGMDLFLPIPLGCIFLLIGGYLTYSGRNDYN